MVKKKVKSVEVKQGDSIKPKMKINPWMVVSIVLAIVIIIGLVANVTSGISKATAERKFIEFAQSQEADVEVIGVEKVGSLYEVTFEFMGQEGRFHVSKDGKYIGQMMEVEPEQTQIIDQAVQQTPSVYTLEDEAKLLEFNTCLAQRGVKVYGANWCGWTIRWIETFGGLKAVTPIYVECEDNRELCSQEGIIGYPTIKIKGQVYSGARTIEAIAQATGCPAPQLTGVVVASQVEASC